MDLKGNSVTWCGHGTWLWDTSEGKRVLVDPWLANNPACPDHLKDPGPLDGILVTHGHFDHIGDAVETINAASGAETVAILETATWLQGKGCENVVGINKGGTYEVAGVKATMVNAVHSGGITDGDAIVYGGDPAGYVIEFPGGLVVYQAGDTDVFGDMALIAEIYQPSVAVLPVGDFFTMGPRQAAHAVRLLGVSQVLCGHFGTFPPLVGRPSQLAELVGSGIEVPELTPGDRV